MPATDSGTRQVAPDPILEAVFVTAVSEAMSNLSCPSPKALLSKSMAPETSRTWPCTQYGLPQGTSANSGEGTSGVVLGAYGQPNNLQPCSRMLDQSVGVSSQKYQHHSQESVLDPAPNSSSMSMRPDHTCETLPQDYPEGENSSHPPCPNAHAVFSYSTAVAAHPLVVTEEPHTLQTSATSTLFLNYYKDVPQDTPIMSTQPLTLPDHYQQLIEAQVLETELKLQVLYILPYVHAIRVGDCLHQYRPQALDGPVHLQNTLKIEIDIDIEAEDLDSLFKLLEYLEQEFKIDIEEELEDLEFRSKPLEYLESRSQSRTRVDSDQLHSYRFNQSSHQSEQTQCVVCLCDFEVQELLRVLPCNHVFHIECIDRWLWAHRTCPFCRAEVQ